MTFQDFFEEVAGQFAGASVKGIGQHLAYQFNIVGEAAGAFYVEVRDEKVYVEPYEYYDRDVLFTAKADVFRKIIAGNMDPVFAFTTGKLKVDGSIETALKLKDVLACLEK